MATASRVFTSLTKPMLFFCQCKGFHIIVHLDETLVLICSKHVGKMEQFFFLFVLLVLHINFFQVRTLPHSVILFLGLFGNTVDISVSVISLILFFSHFLPALQ